MDTRNIKQLDDNDEKYYEQEGESFQKKQQQDEEDDPLDVYMKNLKSNEGTNNKGNIMSLQVTQQFIDDKIEEQRREINNEIQFIQHEEITYIPQKSHNKKIQILKPINFTQINLENFEKDFYQPHQDIQQLTIEQIKQIRQKYQIKVSGCNIPTPILSFAYLNLHQFLYHILIKSQFEKPTAIQAQTLPVALSGRDIVAIAKTGSGKTLAYIIPVITHVCYQRQSEKNQGPIALLLAPTRELCQQIYGQVRKFAKKFEIKISCLLGGQNKHDQWKILKAGVDILIASPGRLIQMIRKKATNLLRVTILVLDQADRMLSMGFEQQIRSIVSQTREDRQTMLFTATMKKSVQFLVNDIITNAIRITIGDQSQANQDIKQQVVVLNDEAAKMNWLLHNLQQLSIQGKILIFINHRKDCQEIGEYLHNHMKILTLVLHGQKTQFERTTIMNKFKQQQSILIATDIAARGIDVKNIKTVINFECPSNIQAYIHRIGRVGRAGVSGVAISLLTSLNVKFAINLIRMLENSGYPVPQQLDNLGCLDQQFRRKRLSTKMGVSFAKGKDVTKFLNQTLKRQKISNSRAGLGLSECKPTQKSNRRNNLSTQYMQPIAEQIDTSSMSITDISSKIRERRAEQLKQQNVQGYFIKASKQGTNSNQQEQITVTYFRK